MWKTYVLIITHDARRLHHHSGDHRERHRPRFYDLVVAQTSGGPGIASEVPAKYVYDYMFQAARTWARALPLHHDARDCRDHSSCRGHIWEFGGGRKRG